MSVYTFDHYNEDGAKVMRPVLTREDYLALRGSSKQTSILNKVRTGRKSLKNSLVQMNYSCIPGDDGLLKGCKTPSRSVGMDIDFVAPEELSPEEQRLAVQASSSLPAIAPPVNFRGKTYIDGGIIPADCKHPAPADKIPLIALKEFVDLDTYMVNFLKP